MKSLNKDFYAFTTSYVIGIFTNLEDALECIGNREYSLVHFNGYHAAMLYIRFSLNTESQIAFGIFKRNMAFNKPYYRQRKKTPFDESSAISSPK